MENKVNSSYAEQLQQIYNSLTPETWIKGSWFSQKNDKLCFCVHGAALNVDNPVIKNTSDLINKISTSAKMLHSGAASIAFTSKAYDSVSLRETWKNRKNAIKTIYGYQDYNSEYSNIHYLLGMFGLTVSFNDESSTTLEMIKEKLLQAINWAKENEEFLQNN